MESILAAVDKYIVREQTIYHISESLAFKGRVVEAVVSKAFYVKNHLYILPSYNDLIRNGIKAVGSGQAVFKRTVTYKFFILGAYAHNLVSFKYDNIPVVSLTVPDALAEGHIINKDSGRCNLMCHQPPEMDESLELFHGCHITYTEADIISYVLELQGNHVELGDSHFYSF